MIPTFLFSFVALQEMTVSPWSPASLEDGLDQEHSSVAG